MQQYQITLTGQTPLLMHAYNFEWADMMKRWLMEPANKKSSIAGDDRTPAFKWMGNIYHDQGIVVLPSDNLMTMFREGGAKCPTGKGQQTFKRQTQSGIVVDQIGWPVIANKKQINYAKDIAPLINELDFTEHCRVANSLGFDLFVKPAPVGSSKHLRVRPRFNEWSASGTITVLDPSITHQVLKQILDTAGMYAGIGDWRPSAPKSPGAFGRFMADINRV